MIDEARTYCLAQPVTMELTEIDRRARIDRLGNMLMLAAHILRKAKGHKTRERTLQSEEMGLGVRRLLPSPPQFVLPSE